MFLVESQPGITITNSPLNSSRARQPPQVQQGISPTKETPPKLDSSVGQSSGNSSALINSNSPVPPLNLHHMVTSSSWPPEPQVKIFLTPDQKFLRYESSNPAIQVVTVIDNSSQHEWLGSTSSTMPTPRATEPRTRALSTSGTPKSPCKNTVTVQTRRLNIHADPDPLIRSYTDRKRSVSVERVVAAKDSYMCNKARQAITQEARTCMIYNAVEFFSDFDTSTIELGSGGWSSLEVLEAGKSLVLAGASGLLTLTNSTSRFLQLASAKGDFCELKVSGNQVLAFGNQSLNLHMFESQLLTNESTLKSNFLPAVSSQPTKQTVGLRYSQDSEYFIWVNSPRDLCIFSIKEMIISEVLYGFWEIDTNKQGQLTTKQAKIPISYLLQPRMVCASRDANIVIGLGEHSASRDFYLVYHNAESNTKTTSYLKVDELCKSRAKQVGALEISKDCKYLFLTCLQENGNSVCCVIRAAKQLTLVSIYNFEDFKNKIVDTMVRVFGYDILICASGENLEIVEYLGGKLQRVRLMRGISRTPIDKLRIEGNSLYILSKTESNLKIVQFGKGNSQSSATRDEQLTRRFSQFNCSQLHLRNQVVLEKVLSWGKSNRLVAGGKSGVTCFEFDPLIDGYVETQKLTRQRIELETGRLTPSDNLVFIESSTNHLVVVAPDGQIINKHAADCIIPTGKSSLLSKMS